MAGSLPKRRSQSTDLSHAIADSAGFAVPEILFLSISVGAQQCRETKRVIDRTCQNILTRIFERTCFESHNNQHKMRSVFEPVKSQMIHAGFFPSARTPRSIDLSISIAEVAKSQLSTSAPFPLGREIAKVIDASCQNILTRISDRSCSMTFAAAQAGKFSRIFDKHS